MGMNDDSVDENVQVDFDGSGKKLDRHEHGTQNLPRSIISSDARSVNRLLSALSLGGPAAAAAWRFLMRLPTNPGMLEAVRSLEGVGRGGVEGSVGGHAEDGGDDAEGRAKWKVLLGPPGSHRMLYMLQILEGVLEYVTGFTDGKKAGLGRREEVTSSGSVSNQAWDWEVRALLVRIWRTFALDSWRSVNPLDARFVRVRLSFLSELPREMLSKMGKSS